MKGLEKFDIVPNSCYIIGTMFIRHKREYAYLVKTYYDKGRVRHWQLYVGRDKAKPIYLKGLFRGEDTLLQAGTDKWKVNYKLEAKRTPLEEKIKNSKLNKKDKQKALLLLDRFFKDTPKQHLEYFKKMKKKLDEGPQLYAAPPEGWYGPELAMYEEMDKMGMRTSDDFEKHFRKMAVVLHPDIPDTGNTEEFKRLLGGYRAFQKLKKYRYNPNKTTPSIPVEIEAG